MTARLNYSGGEIPTHCIPRLVPRNVAITLIVNLGNELTRWCREKDCVRLTWLQSENWQTIQRKQVIGWKKNVSVRDIFIWWSNELRSRRVEQNGTEKEKMQSRFRESVFAGIRIHSVLSRVNRRGSSSSTSPSFLCFSFIPSISLKTWARGIGRWCMRPRVAF